MQLELPAERLFKLGKAADVFSQLGRGAKQFLAKKGHGEADLERMHRAWTKSMLLTLALWSRPYVRDGLW